MKAKPVQNHQIVVRALSKNYHINGRQTAALADINLNIGHGEFLAVTGASGSGKSTLLQLIGGLDRPSSGSVEIDNVDLACLKDADLASFRNRSIGFVFQFFYLQPYLNLRDNIALPAMFVGTAKESRSTRIDELLCQVDLKNEAHKLPSQLSGGQVQRIAVARALFNQPAILLADEPTGNLDSHNSQTVVELFKSARAKNGTTIVLATHNPNIAAQADRVITLKDGEIV